MEECINFSLSKTVMHELSLGVLSSETKAWLIPCHPALRASSGLAVLVGIRI
jgi:hypothetical protein